ncbi:unnamed protein product [Miscanthus lutarioriparius]|uniref:RRM domain-containing protein n=1 Tax=Miscanthus lutarioriparius TaxID=422564 RepID=A0A811QS39_9POAL|nr:unnamed protein product [Miscanthus lutarioriparius]
MGRSGLTGQLQESQSDDMSAAAGYEEGSEEEEPFEVEFYDDDDDELDVEQCNGTALPENKDASDEEPFEVDLCSDKGSGKADSSHSEHYINLVPDGRNTCRNQLYVAEPCHGLMTDKGEFVEKKSNYVQPSKQEQNKKELKQVLRHNNSAQKEVSVAKEKETMPFKKRFSVKFAADVSCYTYSTESFAAATVEKRKVQSDDQDKHLCKRQELSFSSAHDEGKLKEGNDTNLFVGNLPPSLASHKLIELFLPFGRIVRSRVVDDCFTGSSKGYGFVQYSDPCCAAEAIKHMNGRMVEGRMLEVRLADAPSSGSTKEMDMSNLYVCNLPLLLHEDKLHDLFVPYGQVTSVKVVRDHATGLSKGYGFVRYSDPQHAAHAIFQLNGRLIEGKKMEVRVASVSSSGSNPSVQAVSETDHQLTKEVDMSNVYVQNLPLLMNTDKLLNLFLPYGQVTSAKVAMDFTSGISEGYGFVKFSDPHDAAHAVIELNGRLVEGRKILVRVRPSSSPVESHDNNRTLKEIDMSNLYVCNIPSSMNKAKLVELFLPFGKITHAMVVEQSNNSSKGYGFVKFADSHCAAEAIALMNGALIEGESISVRIAGLSPSVSSSVSQHSPHSETNASPEINNCRLYVTNVPQTMPADKLVSLFMPFGQIDRVVMYVEYSLVLYADINSAAKALKHMDGYLIEGKRLVVKGSEPLPVNAGSKLVKEIDMANLYVGRVPSAVTCEQLVQIFCLYGEIVQAKKFDVGYGMIRYANASSAAAAIDELDGYQVGGSTLVVRVAGLPAESDVATFARTPQTPGNEHRQIDMTNLYVGYLPPYVTTDKLIELFLPCGQITQAKVVVDKFTGVSKGFGFVRFADAYSAATAITHMNGYPLDGHMLAVRTAGVQQSDMASYMAHFYSYFTSPDPSRMAVGIPASDWSCYYGQSAYNPYYYAESAYTTPAVHQGQGAESAATAAGKTSQLEGLSGPEPVGSVAERDGSSVSNPAASDGSRLDVWAGPPGCVSHAVAKKDATTMNTSQAWAVAKKEVSMMNTSQACSKVHMVQSEGWAGPPGFEPHAIAKKDATVMNPPQACSKVHMSVSASEKRSSVV